jgi:pimeloyl-ACP methyl ester carboxylesterase
VPCGELWVDQATAGLAKRSVDAATLANVRSAFLEAVDKAARGFASDDEFYDSGRDVLLAHGVAPEDVTHDLVDSVMSDLRTPWYRYFLGWDPGTYVSRLESPLLAVWGEQDREVGAAKNAALFETAMQSRPDADFTVQILPGDDHFFLRNPAGESLPEHDYGRMHVSPVLLETVATWIRSRTGLARSAK